MGRLKEDFYKGAAAEYSKRLSRFHKFELIEIPETNDDTVGSRFHPGRKEHELAADILFKRICELRR